MTWRAIRVPFGIFLLLLAVEALALMGEAMPVMQPVLRFASDGSMRVQAEWPFGKNNELKLGFIQMDDDFERRHTQWDRTTDRVELSHIISKAANQNPAPTALIVDVDLSLLSQKNGDFLKYLTEYDLPVPLIIVKTLQPRKTDKGFEFVEPGTGERKIKVVEAFPDNGPNAPGGQNIYSDKTLAQKPRLHFASAGFLTADGTVRSAIITEAVCEIRDDTVHDDGCVSGDLCVHGMPSVELLVLGLLDDRLHHRLKDFETDVSRTFKGRCDDARIDPAHILTLEPKLGHTLDIDQVGRNAGLIGFELHPMKTGVYDDQLNVVSATDFLAKCEPAEGAAKDPAPPECNMTERIVVIGGNPEGDERMTPLGEMSGGLVLLNAIDSLYENGQIKRFPRWVVVLIGFGFGFGIWLISSRLIPNNAGMVAALIFVVVMTVLLNHVLLRHGRWFDLGPPLLGFCAHPLVESLFHLGGDVKTHGWRALLNREPSRTRQAHHAVKSAPLNADEDDDEEAVVR